MIHLHSICQLHSKMFYCNIETYYCIQLKRNCFFILGYNTWWSPYHASTCGWDSLFTWCSQKHKLWWPYEANRLCWWSTGSWETMKLCDVKNWWFQILARGLLLEYHPNLWKLRLLVKPQHYTMKLKIYLKKHHWI